MKIRTQLIVALLLLAVLPLAAIVVFSYVASLRAVPQSVEAEAAPLTAEMDRRLAAVKGDLQRRVDRLGGRSFGELAGTAAPEAGGGSRRCQPTTWKRSSSRSPGNTGRSWPPSRAPGRESLRAFSSASTFA